jgi:signal transduction histidine kinase/CheY-like chemotaxis protein
MPAMGGMAAGQVGLVDDRIEEILRARTAPICVAMLVTIPVAFFYCVWIRPAPLAAGLGGAAWLAAALVLLTDRRGRMPRRGITVVMFGLWLLTLLAALAAYHALRDPMWMAMSLLLLVGQGAIQLRTGSFAFEVVVGSLACLGVQAEVGAITLPVIMAVTVAVALAMLAYQIGRGHVVELEERGRALTAALARAEAALADRARAEAEGERLRAQFIEAQKMEAVGTLAGGLAHDVNNLLGGILGLAELARDETSGQVRDDVDEIIAACKRGGAMTRNLLAFSRRGQYHRERVRLDDVAGRVVALLSRTAPKRVTVGLELDGGQLEVEGDATQLGQALLNLCLNSIDAIPNEGRVTICAREIGADDPRLARLGLPAARAVALSVRDDGVGMDHETSRRIFEPFFTTKEPGKGTGLGLAMVYGTTRAHGGQVDVATEPGSGTEVSMVLPAATGGVAVAGPDLAVVAAAPVGVHAVPPRGRILVVDDEPLVRAMARRQLERSGYQVDVAENGAQAVELYKQQRVDVVLLDMAMPVMDGATCFAALRVVDPQVHVVLASGYALQDEARSCLDAGALGFLHKPYSSTALLLAVETAARGERLTVLAESPPG